MGGGGQEGTKEAGVVEAAEPQVHVGLLGEQRGEVLVEVEEAHDRQSADRRREPQPDRGVGVVLWGAVRRVLAALGCAVSQRQCTRRVAYERSLCARVLEQQSSSPSQAVSSVGERDQPPGQQPRKEAAAAGGGFSGGVRTTSHGREMAVPLTPFAMPGSLSSTELT